MILITDKALLKPFCAEKRLWQGIPSVARTRGGRLFVTFYSGGYTEDYGNFCAVLQSDDDGATWRGGLCIDSRPNVSYPDVDESEDGLIYIVYDRERGAHKSSLADALTDAREILMAKINEADILAGELVDPRSRLQLIVSKLELYTGTDFFAVPGQSPS